MNQRFDLTPGVRGFVGWTIFALVVAVLLLWLPTLMSARLGVPGLVFQRGLNAEEVTAWGQWIGDVIVAVAAVFAIYQLALSKQSSAVDAFLKVCDVVNDAEFTSKYNLVYGEQARLRDPRVSAKGLAVLVKVENYDEICAAVYGVLDQLTRIAYILEYTAVSRRMVVDYVGDIVVQCAYSLENYLIFEKGNGNYEKFRWLATICLAQGWKPDHEQTPKLSSTGHAR
jgi:hypothetical protein